MSIWGAVKDAEKGHKAYVVPDDEDADVLPPVPPKDPVTTTTATTTTATTSTTTGTGTKSYARPTDHLPGDHGSAEGENSKPAFSSTSTATATQPAEDIAESASASATHTPTPDEGWFADLSNLVSNQVWFFVALGAVLLFAAGAGLFFWRRAVRRRRRARADYAALRGEDDVALGRVGRAPRGTKELYDAFGEVDDDDEDADEETALRPHAVEPALDSSLHTGFLDDDDPPTAGSGGRHDARYRDEPESPVSREGDRSDSPGSGSGSGSSWEHASETR